LYNEVHEEIKTILEGIVMNEQVEIRISVSEVTPEQLEIISKQMKKIMVEVNKEERNEKEIEMKEIQDGWKRLKHWANGR